MGRVLGERVEIEGLVWEKPEEEGREKKRED